MDSRRTPRWVVGRQPANQGANLGVRRWPPQASATRFPRPALSESFTMPADDGCGLDDDQDLPPSGPPASEPQPEETVSSAEPWPRSLCGEGRELLPEGEVFEHEVDSRNEQGAEPTAKSCDSGQHRGRMNAGDPSVNGSPPTPKGVSSARPQPIRIQGGRRIGEGQALLGRGTGEAVRFSYPPRQGSGARSRAFPSGSSRP